jgi:hypothetical protein
MLDSSFNRYFLSKDNLNKNNRNVTSGLHHASLHPNISLQVSPVDRGEEETMNEDPERKSEKDEYQRGNIAVQISASSAFVSESAT